MNGIEITVLPNSVWQKREKRSFKGICLEKALVQMKKIEQRSFPKEDSMVHTLEAELKKRTNQLILATCKSQELGNHPVVVVGYLIFGNNSKQEGCSRILKIAVNQRHRGLGIGTKLLQVTMDHVSAFFPPLSCTRTIQLHVAHSRSIAFRLYLKAGFKVVKNIPDYYAEGRSAYLMEIVVK